MKTLTALALVLLVSGAATAQTLCPDGTYVGGERCVLAPDGSYVGTDEPLFDRLRFGSRTIDALRRRRERRELRALEEEAIARTEARAECEAERAPEWQASLDNLAEIKKTLDELQMDGYERLRRLTIESYLANIDACVEAKVTFPSMSLDELEKFIEQQTEESE